MAAGNAYSLHGRVLFFLEFEIEFYEDSGNLHLNMRQSETIYYEYTSAVVFSFLHFAFC